MIVLDASALLEILLRTPAAGAIEMRLLASDEGLHAPHLLDVEVAHVMRRLGMIGEIAPENAHEAFRTLAEFPVERHAHGALLTRVWDLRHNVSAYDGVYVALAEALGATLMTHDRRLADTAAKWVTVALV